MVRWGQLKQVLHSGKQKVLYILIHALTVNLFLKDDEDILFLIFFFIQIVIFLCVLYLCLSLSNILTIQDENCEFKSNLSYEG